ncbi:flagellar hook-associated protein FlgK [Rheinheimera sp.]|uniref:flagellar hook-associated protein FlgK n=1 Tax=Rheinheimera sp. TaxID=1869214 RepID=UPI00307D317D
MSDNLLKIGTSAILSSAALLSTTSNNIANVNAEGYTRQRTEFEANILGLGVGRGTTERLVNNFALKQLWRDTSAVGYASQYVSEAGRVDSLFADSSNSISTGISNLFTQLQTAINDPSSSAARQLVIGGAQTLLNKFSTLSSQVLDQGTYVNEQLAVYAKEANSYINSIATLNREILNYGTNPAKPPPLDLLDKRDETIRKLSELMDIQVLDAANGEKQIFMGTGQSLVMEDGKFNLFNIAGDPDPQRQTLQLQVNGKNTIVASVDENDIGGKIGGLLKFRSEILEPAQLQLGQLAISFADAFNTQNKLGMDGDGLIGQDIFKLPAFSGLPLSRNTGDGTVAGTFVPTLGKEIPANNFKVVFSNATQFTVQALDSDGNVVSTRPEAPATEYNLVGAGPYTFTSSATEDLFGLEFTITNGGTAFAAGDAFELKPLADAAANVQLATNRPNAIALASPLVGDTANSNLGNAKVEGLVVSSIGGATDLLSAPSTFNAGQPLTITYLGGNQFEVNDNNGTTETYTFPSNNYEDFLSNFPSFANAGFEFAISGVPTAGDTFTIDYNVGGFKDNRNGLLLGQLQNSDTVRISAENIPNADKYQSFTQAYGSMVGYIGERTSQAKINLSAQSALLEQTSAWNESLSGVSMDEEAADLVRFQQTYAAAAKILSASQSIFDTLLQATR